jgi:hypothetical protein
MTQPVILLTRQLPAALMTARRQFGELHMLDPAGGAIREGQMLVSTAIDPVSAAPAADIAPTWHAASELTSLTSSSTGHPSIAAINL